MALARERAITAGDTTLADTLGRAMDELVSQLSNLTEN